MSWGATACGAGGEEFPAVAEFLEGIAAAGERFWCHQGIRRPVRWVHPSGAEWTGSPAAYSPPIVGAVPYRADGRPAELCAGWDARRRALAAGWGEDGDGQCGCGEAAAEGASWPT